MQKMLSLVTSVDSSSNLINKLKNIKVEKISDDPLIRLRLNQIKLQATMPVCTEQVISILVEMFSLKYDFKIDLFEILSRGQKLDEPAIILANSILPLLEHELESELGNKLKETINAFQREEYSEKAFFEAIKTLHNKYISHISSIDSSICSIFIDELKNISVEEISSDSLIQLKLNQIKLLATMPFCAEQVISMVVEILSLKLRYNIDLFSFLAESLKNNYNIDLLSRAINQGVLANIPVEEISSDPLVHLKLNKIKLQATMPFCAEQVIAILAENLSLKHDYNIDLFSILAKNPKLKLEKEEFKRREKNNNTGLLSRTLKFDELANIFVFVNSILPLLGREHNSRLCDMFKATINAFQRKEFSEKAFFGEIKDLRDTHVSCVDIDFVMRATAQTQKSRATVGKKAILLAGKTGAGKSFVVNYMFCEEMFSQPMFGNLKIHYEKQPKFLRHIEFGNSVESKTFKMGVVDVSESKSKWMAKYSDSNYVICDTPGAGDNREFGGPELKLANSLEIIVPMYKAESVRLLVIIHSRAADDPRGDELKETIQFVSKMFDNPNDLKSAANAMVFAINGKDGEKKVEAFVELLKGFLQSKGSLGLNNNDEALIEILKNKFESSEVCFIQPGKKVGIRPEDLMSKLHACDEIDPKTLTPFAESDIKESLKQETNLLTQSIDEIIDSLERDLLDTSNVVMQIQVQRLGQKLAKLSFMDAYYSINQSNLVPYFKKIADLMERLQQRILSILCPENGAVQGEKIKIAKEALGRLCELDQMVSMMINGLFYDDRERTASLIAAFDETATAPRGFETMEEYDWFNWVATHRPKNAAKQIEDEIERYRSALAERLTTLIGIKLRQIQIETVVSLQNEPQQSVVLHARTVSLDREHLVFWEHVGKILGDVIKTRSDFRLGEYTSEVTENLEKEISAYIPSHSSLEFELVYIIQNLRIHAIPLEDLFFSNNKLSWSDQSNSASEQLFILIQQLIEYAKAANLNNDFAVVIKIIETIDNLVNGFGLESFQDKMPDYQEKMIDLRGDFRKSFINFIRSTCELISKNDYEPLNENDIQILIFNFSIIANVTKLEAFANFEKSGLYVSCFTIELGQLKQHLYSRFSKIKEVIKSLCQEYTEGNYLAIDIRLVQLWYLLSLPSDNHAQLTFEYAEVVNDVREFSMQKSGELAGQLRADSPLDNALYEKIKAYLNQLKSLTMVTVLKLDQAKENIKNALNQRALRLIEAVGTADLELSNGDSLISDAHLIQETKKLKDEFSEDLPLPTIVELRETLKVYYEKVSNTLMSIVKRIQEDLKFDKNEEMPVEFFILSNRYLNNCEEVAIFSKEMIDEFRQHLKNATQKYEAVKKLLMTEMLESLKPTASASDVKPEMITALIDQFKQLSINLVSDSDLIQGWIHELNELLFQYQSALTEALQQATSGKSDNHEELLKRVEQFQVFDAYIKEYFKQSRNNDERRFTFKKLFRRFENAFKGENFTKLHGVMSAVYEGNFVEAQRLATDNKELASNVDMRLVLTDLIETYILASFRTIEWNIAQLEENPVANSSYMKELMQSYDCIKSAQKLVEAGLLSERLLDKREELFSETQDALDVWLAAVIKKIDAHIENLDFKSAHFQISDLQKLLESEFMQLKPNDAHVFISQVKERFDDKVHKCLAQYQRPLINWDKNNYSLFQVAIAFAAVRDLPYYKGTFGNYWENISAQVYQIIDERCKRIEEEFREGTINVEEALEALEQIASIIEGVQDESTHLHDNIKARCQRTGVQIQEYSKNIGNEEERLKNIQILIDAGDRLAKSLLEIDFTTARSFLSEKAESLKQSIFAKLNHDEFPVEDLVLFANLYRRFPQFNFLQVDRELYASTLEKIVNSALTEIKEGISSYKSGADKSAALKQIHAALKQLIKVQNLSKATNKMAKLVDATLPYQVVTLLKEVKGLLEANVLRFKTALISKDRGDLEQALVVASPFQEVTRSIDQYIIACSFPTPLPQEFQTLEQLNIDFSYVGLHNLLIAELKNIRYGLEKLNPATLENVGLGIRIEFYVNLGRNIEFIFKMSELDEWLNKKYLVDNGVAEDYGLKQCFNELSWFLGKIFHLVQHQLKKVSIPSVADEWGDFNLYYRELVIFADQCSCIPCLSPLKISKKMLLGEDTDLSSPPLELLDEDTDLSSSSTDLLGEDADLSSSSTDGSIEASVLAQFAQEMFLKYFDRVVITFINHFQPWENDEELVALLAGLQKMADDMSFLAKVIKTKLKEFLKVIQNKSSPKYMTSLAALLRAEETGYGARMVTQQPVFAGMMIAERNMLTLKYDITYVLKKMEVKDEKTGKIRLLSEIESEQLLEQYHQFDENYQKLIDEYTSPQKNFAKFRESHLETLKQELSDLIPDKYKEKEKGKEKEKEKGKEKEKEKGKEKEEKEKEKNKHIIWDEEITSLVPKLYAYLFTIWTLTESSEYFEETKTESSEYFEETNTDSNRGFLKQPHPAQIVAIFQMLNTIDAKKSLSNVLNELLTGEGKSVVLALTASLLALLGFAVEVGCYSEYLSKRDEKAFQWLFKFLEISKFIKYGTFNQLTEDMLNREGDLRALLDNALFDKKNPINPKEDDDKEIIALVDEVDSLVTAFFGFMFQPYFLLRGEEITALLDAIWARHKNSSIKMTSRELLNLPEYKACLEHYKGREYIIKQAAKEMFDDLQRYTRDQGHDFYVNSKGEIYYKLFDGTTMFKIIGYRTYWACKDPINNINPDCKKANEGIIIPVASYSYVDLMCRASDRGRPPYRAILGVTGTCRELSDEEKKVVKEVFNIERSSFIPSAYGENKLNFTPGSQFHVINDDYDGVYDIELAGAIAKCRVGKNGQPIRPVLIFFDTEEELEAFYNCESFRDYKSFAHKMTSQTITDISERDDWINKATLPGAITLAVKEHGRGSDFILTNDTIIANGGMAVIGAFVPETEAEERQLKGRAARQGQEGSFTMVIRKSEIIKKFGLELLSEEQIKKICKAYNLDTEVDTEEKIKNAHKAGVFDKIIGEQIDKARDAGNLYKDISDARNKKFSNGYQNLVDGQGELVKEFHLPAMNLLDALRKKASIEEIIDTHKKALHYVEDKVELRKAKVLILIDSTGSMQPAIKAVQETLVMVVEALGDVLGKDNGAFQLQIAHYKDYCDGQKALQWMDEWSCDPKELKDFINSVQVSGGGNNKFECVELALLHANQLGGLDGGLDRVLLFGDEQPSPEEEIVAFKYKKGVSVKARHYREEAQDLALKNVQVFTFFAPTPTFYNVKDETGKKYLTEEAFREIAEITGGTAGKLDLTDPATTAEQVTKLIGAAVIGTAANGDVEKERELLEKYSERIHQFRN